MNVCESVCVVRLCVCVRERMCVTVCVYVCERVFNYFKDILLICCNLLASCALVNVPGGICRERLVSRDERHWYSQNLVKKKFSTKFHVALGASHENLLSSLLKDIETHFLPTWRHLWCGWSLHADKHRVRGCWRQ